MSVGHWITLSKTVHWILPEILHEVRSSGSKADEDESFIKILIMETMPKIFSKTGF